MEWVEWKCTVAHFPSVAEALGLFGPNNVRVEEVAQETNLASETCQGTT